MRDDEGGRRAARYVTRIANMFRGGEDTAVVLSALSSYDRLLELKKAGRS
jgi:hypothetical protein